MKSMSVCYILCGLAVCLSALAVWRSMKNVKTIKVLVQIVRSIEPLYESVGHIYDYLLHDHNDGEEEGLR